MTLASAELLTIGGEQVFLSAWLDLSRRKRAEEALRQSEARYRVVDQASDAFFLHDAEVRFVDVNRRACETLGYTRQELLAMTVFDLETEFDVSRAKEVWNRIQPNQPLTVYGCHRRKDGSTFPVEARLVACVIGGERLFLGLLRDITERGRMQAALRDSESRYGKTFRESYPDAPWEYWVGQLGAVAVTGTSRRIEHADVSGRHIDAIAYSPYPGRFAAVFADVTSGAEPKSICATRRSSRASAFWPAASRTISTIC